MRSNITGFRVLYKNHAYNVVDLNAVDFERVTDDRENGIFKCEYLGVLVADIDGQLYLLRDKTNKFQFFENN